MLESLLLMILFMLCVIVIAMPKQLSLREQSDREFDALLARERARNPQPRVPAFGWPRMFFLTNSERAFLQREPWLFCTVLFVLLIVVTVGGGYLRAHGLI